MPDLKKLKNSGKIMTIKDHRTTLKVISKNPKIISKNVKKTGKITLQQLPPIELPTITFLGVDPESEGPHPVCGFLRVSLFNRHGQLTQFPVNIPLPPQQTVTLNKNNAVKGVFDLIDAFAEDCVPIIGSTTLEIDPNASQTCYLLRIDVVTNGNVNCKECLNKGLNKCSKCNGKTCGKENKAEKENRCPSESNSKILEGVVRIVPCGAENEFVFTDSTQVFFQQVPIGAAFAQITAVGGGGSGSGGGSDVFDEGLGGGGGGSGLIREGIFPVRFGQTIQIQVGAGGVGDEANGQATRVERLGDGRDVLLIANGGRGGFFSTHFSRGGDGSGGGGAGAVHGAPGLGEVEDGKPPVGANGGAGGAGGGDGGIGVGGGRGGGGGGGPNGGNGGGFDQMGFQINANNGGIPGGGGGGGYAKILRFFIIGKGGNGGNGAVRLKFCVNINCF